MIATLLVVTLAVSVAAFLTWNNTRANATIQVEFTPKSSLASLNGKRISFGNHRIQPGNYEIIIEKQGFTTQTKRVAVKKDMTSYVGVVMQSNSPDTSNWYETHPEDMMLIERISSNEFNESTKNVTKDHPLLTSLPFTAPGFSFSVTSSQIDEKGEPIILIKYFTPQDRDDAVTWIRANGFNPDNMNIVYESESESESQD